MGTSVSALGIGQAQAFDTTNSVEVELGRTEDWLESRDDDALAAGENLALIGNEIFQFGSALPTGPGRFRLSRLLRGRRGTEWAMALHQAGEDFLLIDPASVRRIDDPALLPGVQLRATPAGLADTNAAPVERIVTGEAMRPPSPVHLNSRYDPGGDLNIDWVRRSRNGWAWLDSVDAPIGSSNETYRLTLRGAGGEFVVETATSSVKVDAAQLATLGSGLTAEVVQIGDFAESRSAFLTIPNN